MNRIVSIIAVGLVSVVGLFTLSGCESSNNGDGIAEWGDTIRVCENIAYGSKARNHYDVYFPVAANERDEHALVLFLHGGSWTSGDKSSMAQDCRFFAERGYVTATMNYSFLNMLGEEKSDFTIMVAEISQALSAIKSYAATQGVNITKVALSGYSAGAHLALLYSYSMVGNSPLPVLFVHSKAGPADFRTFTPDSPEVQEFLKRMGVSGGELSVEELFQSEMIVNMIKAVSPVFYVKKGAAPAILSYGRKDSLVVWDNVVSMMNVLDAEGVEYTLVEYPNSGHGLDKDADGAQRSVDAMLDYAKKYFGY